MTTDRPDPVPSTRPEEPTDTELLARLGWPDADDLARKEQDVPVFDTTPVDGTLRCDEGIHVGYRAWLRASGPSPRFAFGSGQGYTTWATRISPHRRGSGPAGGSSCR